MKEAKRVRQNKTKYIILACMSCLSYTKATLEECEEDRLSNLKKYNANDLESISFVIVDKLEENYVNLMNNELSEVTEVANKLLTKNSHTVASESTLFKKLYRELLIAEQKVLKTELKRWGGDYSDQPIKFGANDEPDEVPTELLSKVIEAHIKEHKNIWEPRGYKGYLSNQPNGSGGTLFSASINKHLSYVVTLFNWGKGQGFCSKDNPVSGLKVIFTDDYTFFKA